MTNENKQIVETTQDICDDRISSLSLITNSDSMKNVTALAAMMAESKVTVPKHLQGSKGDCLAIIIQASNWGMNPFTVAQKTHLVNGVLGYEAQLVNAVVQQSGSITGTFKYEYKGEGNDLSCRVGAVLKGEKDVTWGEWLCRKDITTQNSPLWKTNPKQQMGYLQVKNWARLYAPAAILGVYSDDELADFTPEKDITGVAQAVEQSKAPYTDEQLDANQAAWETAIINNKTTAERIVVMIKSKHTLTADQETRILNIGKGAEKVNVVDAEFLSQMETAEQSQGSV